MPGLPDFAAARILVVGDVMLDRYWSGPTSRISPEAPVPVVKIEGAEARPGAAANVALNLAALGVRTTLLGVIGRDDPGRILRENLTAVGIRSEWIESPNRPTITKLRVLSRNQQVLRLDFEEPLGDPEAFPRAALLQRFRALLADTDAVILSDYDKGTLADVPEFIAAAREAGKAVLIDPKGRDYTRYRGATLLTPNVPELEAVVGACDNDVQLLERGVALLQELNLAALLITRSDKGMTLLRRSGLPVHLPTEAREVFDVTGAGDTVIAMLSAALAAGETLERAMRLANLAAGIVVGKLGTATVSRSELARALAGDTPPGGVLDEDALVAAVAAAKAAGRRVVMTNGCFDLLHRGHVRYLEAAKALGDLLVVAVNDDESARRLKGRERPVNPVADRMALLAALKAVDWVVPFSEETPARLIGRVLPDTLVKGGDYRPEQVAGFEAVIAAGGRVQVVDFHEGYSTTALIERARRA